MAAFTINDIARIAGVSKATVSRVLNNNSKVDKGLRDKVLAVIEEADYRPSALARGLVKNESKLIGIMIPNIANNVFGVLIEGVSRVAELYGYDIILSLTGVTSNKELHYLNLYRDKQVDGIIFGSEEFKKEHIETIQRYNIPCVLMGKKSTIPEIPSVHIDDFSASYEAVRTLIQLGHRQIAMIRAPLHVESVGEERYRGYTAALADAGLEMKEDNIGVSGFEIAGGYTAMRQIVERGMKPTAVFAAADRIAIGAINYLQDHHYSIPEDISVFGFDDIDIAQIIRPQLSTVSYSPIELGMTAFRSLIKLIKKEEIPAQHTNIPHQIIIRESVRSI
jgi:LacI family transcriptional regulator